MSRIHRFTFVADDREKAALSALARRYRRTRSDIVRMLIMKAMRGLKDATPTVRPESIPEVSDAISTNTESLTRIRNEEDSTAASVAKLKAADESTRATPKGSHNYEF